MFVIIFLYLGIDFCQVGLLLLEGSAQGIEYFPADLLDIE